MTRTFGYVALFGFAVVGASVAVVTLFVRLYRRSAHDPALRLQTPVQKFSGYDQAKAVAAAKRAGHTAAQMDEQDRVARTKQTREFPRPVAR